MKPAKFTSVPRFRFPLSAEELRMLCSAAQVSDTTARKYLKGKPVRPLLAASIAAAVDLLGYSDKIRKAA